MDSFNSLLVGNLCFLKGASPLIFMLAKNQRDDD